MWKFGFNDFNNLSELRGLGSPGQLTENSRVGSSILSLGNSFVNKDSGNQFGILFFFNQGKPWYSVNLLLDKYRSNMYDKVLEVIDELFTEGAGVWYLKLPRLKPKIP
jgi:hypothetical protein